MALLPRHVVIAAVLMAVFLMIATLTAKAAAEEAVDSVQTTSDTVHNNKEDPDLTCKEDDSDADSNHKDDSNHKSIQDENRSHHRGQDGVISVIDVIVKTPVLQKFHDALVKACLVDMIFTGDGPFTVVAPRDIAIQDFKWTRIFSNDEWILHLRDLLLFHIHIGGIPLVAESDDKTKYNDDNDDGDSDTRGSEGTTIVMANGQELKILRQISIQRVQFTDQTQSVRQIAYQEASNGYMYMIDTVLMPPSLLYTLDTTIFAGSAETSFFYSLLELADLTYLLQGENDYVDDDDVYTILAPTNTAFAKVKREYIDFLQSPEGSDKLHEILLYHIVPNHVYASIHLLPISQQDDAIMMQPKKLQTMLNGRDITVVAVNNENDISTSTIHLHGDNMAKVVVADKLARNGVLHMISKVLLPPYRPEATTTSTLEETIADDTASTFSGTSTGSSSRVGSHGTRDKIPAIQTRPQTLAAPSLPAPATESKTLVATPTPTREWSLQSPTMIDIINVPIVRYPRGNGGVKLKIILP